jgi:hypothetical protein
MSSFGERLTALQVVSRIILTRSTNFEGGPK